MQDNKMQHNIAHMENSGHENARNGEQGKPRMHKHIGQFTAL